MRAALLDDYLMSHAWSANTRDRYKRAITLILDDLTELELETLSPDQFHKWLLSHDQWGASQIYINYTAIRGYISWRFGSQHSALLLKLKKPAMSPQRTLDSKQVNTLLTYFDTMDPTGKGQRDLAMCSLMIDSGIRATEVCRLSMKHFSLENRRFSVQVKGGKWGDGIFSTQTARFISNWLPYRSKIVQAGISNLFISVGGNAPGKPLTRDGLGWIVREWGKDSGIGPLSPHDFRRTFATLSTRLGAPARIVQLAGRWADMAMVERYTQALQIDDFEPYFPINKIMSM